MKRPGHIYEEAMKASLLYFAARGFAPADVLPALPSRKFTPYHDELGRFTFGPGDDAGSQPPQSPKNLSISDKGVAFIASHENFRPYVYPDSAGRPTIGYGHLLLPGESYPEGITKEQGQQLMASDLATAEQAIRNQVKVPLTQNQFDALTSLTYNIGGGGLGKSTVLRLLNQGDYNGAANHFADWNKVPANGVYKVEQGLVNRRAAEKNIFLNAIYP